jgi:CRP-like cAMP-binding protein
MTEPSTLELSVLRTFSPLDGLKSENLRALARKTTVRELGQGRLLFKEGDTDKRTFYLVSGAVDLLSEGHIVGTIRGGTPDAKHPIAPILPRRCTARVATDRIEYVSIDSDLLDVLITWDQTGTYEVGELQAGSAAGDDWMTLLLQSRAFHRIPPANLQAVFMRMQRIDYAAGDTIIRQGDDGDYFYAIVQGRCLVNRETPLNREGIKLAELGMGDTFGEEALISGAKRNATVTMLTDGTLMRLGKEDFNTLLNEPMLRWVDDAAARQAVALRERHQRAALLRPAQAQDPRSLGPLRRVLRERAAQFRRRLHPERAWLRRLRAAGRHCRHGPGRGTELPGQAQLSIRGRRPSGPGHPESHPSPLRDGGSPPIAKPLRREY